MRETRKSSLNRRHVRSICCAPLLASSGERGSLLLQESYLASTSALSSSVPTPTPQRRILGSIWYVSHT